MDIESERWRFLGGARFTVGAIVRVLFMRRYDARIRFRPLGAEDAADAAFFLEDGSSDDDDDQDGAFYNKFDISRSRKRKGSTYNVSGAHRMGNPHDSRVAKRAAKAAARGATAGVEMPDRPGWREIVGWTCRAVGAEPAVGGGGHVRRPRRAVLRRRLRLARVQGPLAPVPAAQPARSTPAGTCRTAG